MIEQLKYKYPQLKSKKIVAASLLNPKHNGTDELQHIIQLAHDKGVPVELSSVDLGNYKVCGIIKNLADM